MILQYIIKQQEQSSHKTALQHLPKQSYESI